MWLGLRFASIGEFGLGGLRHSRVLLLTRLELWPAVSRSLAVGALGNLRSRPALQTA